MKIDDSVPINSAFSGLCLFFSTQTILKIIQNNIPAPSGITLAFQAAFYEDYAEDLRHGFQFLAYNFLEDFKVFPWRGIDTECTVGCQLQFNKNGFEKQFHSSQNLSLLFSLIMFVFHQNIIVSTSTYAVGSRITR